MTSTDLKTLLSKAAPGVVSNYEDSAGKVAKKSKYGNSKVTIDGIRFDSIKEGKRYQVLLLMERMGLITELKGQVVYLLVVDKTVNYTLSYIADFVYKDKFGNDVVEDVKPYSNKTKKYYLTHIFKQKKRLMLEKYGISVKIF